MLALKFYEKNVLSRGFQIRQLSHFVSLILANSFIFGTSLQAKSDLSVAVGGFLKHEFKKRVSDVATNRDKTQLSVRCHDSSMLGLHLVSASVLTISST